MTDPLRVRRPGWEATRPGSSRRRPDTNQFCPMPSGNRVWLANLVLETQRREGIV